MTKAQKRSRRIYEATFAPIGRVVAKTGITANALTIIAVLISILSAFFYAIQNPLLGMVFLVCSSLADMLDGSVARARGTSSQFGTIFDHTMDRISEFFFLLGIMAGRYSPPEFVFFCFEGMLMASFIRAKAESMGVDNCSVGIMERKEKLTLLGFASFLEFLNQYQLYPVIKTWPLGAPFLPLALALLIIGTLSNISALQRLLYAKKYFKMMNTEK